MDFVRETVDFLDNVGLGASITLDPDGNPHLSYVGVPQELASGQLPVARPPSAPALPAIMSALRLEGSWRRGFVVETDISGLEPEVLPVDETDTTDNLIVEDTVHVAWTQEDGVYYSAAPAGTNDYAVPSQKVFDGSAAGPSVTLDADGTPLVAFYALDGEEVVVMAATAPPPQEDGGAGEGEGEGEEPAPQPEWSLEEIAAIGACDDCPGLRTAAVTGPDGPVVAFTSGGDGPVMATRPDVAGTEPWTTTPIDETPGGFGLALAVADGVVLATYLTEGGEVRLARIEGSTVGDPETVGSFQGQDPAEELAGGTAVAGGGEAVFVAWHDPEAEEVRLAQSEGGADFEDVDTPGTIGGSHPALAVSDEGKAYLAWYDAPDQDLAVGIFPEEFGLLANPAPVEGGGGPAPPVATCEPDGTELQIAAQGILFDKDCLAAPADEAFTIDFENLEAIPHNVSIVQSLDIAETPIGEGLFVGEALEQPDTVVYEVDPLEAGDYFFRCDFHPATMVGNFFVQ